VNEYTLLLPFTPSRLHAFTREAITLRAFTPSLAKQHGIELKNDIKKSDRKAKIDAVLLRFPGVSAREINGLGAYFVNDKMFACISGEGIGLRLPVTAATELQFSRNDVVPFQPRGITSTREWIQINRADADEYEKDLALFQESIDFVKATGSA